MDNVLQDWKQFELLGLDPEDDEKPVDLPLGEEMMDILANDLENIENLVVLSQGSSQKSIGEVQATLAVSTFEQPKSVRSSPWVFSHTLGRLFLKNLVKVPFRFRCEGTYSNQMEIAVSLRYQVEQHQEEPVEVCPNHISSNIEGQHLFHPRHPVQYSGEKKVQYEEPPNSAHYVIKIPVSKEAFSPSGQSENLMFVCLSTCMLIRRRRMLLCAELHYRDQVLSKVDVPTKISVCPVRDMMNEEARVARNDSSESQKHPPEKRARLAMDSASNSSSTAPLSEVIVRVKGRKFVEELRVFLAARIPSEHYAVFSHLPTLR